MDIGGVEPTPLGFSFHLVGGTGKLALREQRFFEWVQVDRLELEVPDLPLPVDLADGPGRFQRRRTRVVLATLRMDQADIDRFVARAGPALAEAGVDELSVRACDGYLSISGRARDDRWAADFTSRIYVRGRGTNLRLVAAEPTVFGYLPNPGPLLTHRIMTILLGPDADARGLGDFDIAPLESFLWCALPPAGWRLPDASALTIAAARSARSAVEISYVARRDPAESGATATAARGASDLTIAAAAAYLESLKRFRAADEYLLHRDIDSALRAYRGELARGADQPHLIARMLGVACSHPAWFRDAADLARDALGRWPDFGPAHAARAAIALYESDTARAAEHYSHLSNLSAQGGDDEVCARAALAGARLLRSSAPAEATPLYERVLEHRPGHGESIEALGERYASEGRWQDLVRLIRTRIATTADRNRQARDHVRLATILRDELGDAGRARDELELATQLAPDLVVAWKTLAQTLSTLGEQALAVRAYDTAAELFATRDDAAGEAHAHIRVAETWEETGDRDKAAARFERALALLPDSAPALEGAARVAVADGRHDEAAALLTRRIDTGVDEPATRAELQCQLGRALRAAGKSDAARAPLADAATSGVGASAAEAWALLADIDADTDPSQAADALALAIAALGGDDPAHADVDARTSARIAELALARGRLLGPDDGAPDFELAFALDGGGASGRTAARALYEAAAARDDVEESRRWINALVTEGIDAAEEIEARLARGALNMRAGDTDTAEIDLNRVLGSRLADELSESQRARALALQAELSELSGDTVGRARALSERAEQLARRTDHATAAIDALVEAARAWLAADDTDEALAAARRAAVYASEDASDDDSDDSDAREREVFETLGIAAWRRRAWNDVARAYAALLARDDVSSANAATFAHRLGIAHDKLGNIDAAIDALERVTAEQAAAGEALATSWRVLAGLYERKGDSSMSAAALESFAGDDRTDATPNVRADAWYRAGELHRKLAGGLPGRDAERCLEHAVRLVTDHMPALDALERLKGVEEDWERVAVILGRKIAATARQPDRQKALLARLAEVQGGKLGRADVATESYKRALEIDPSYRPALEFIARHAAAEGDAAGAVAAYARLLEALDEASAHLDPEAVAKERTAIALELSALAANAGRHEDAIAPLTSALQQSPNSATLLAALAGAYRSTEQWFEAAEVLGRLAAATDDAATALQSDLQRIAIYQSHLEDTGAAWAACRSAIARSPDEPSLLAAAVALARAAGRAADMVDALQAAANNGRAAQLVSSSPADLFAEAADTARAALGDRDRAVELYRLALDSDPTHVGARAGLAEADHLDGDDAPSERTAAMRNPVETARALLDADDPEAAIDLLANFDLDAASTDLLQLRAELNETLERWQDAAADLRALRARGAAENHLAAEHQATRRLAAITLERLHDSSAAIGLFQRALELDPDDLAAAEALAGIYGRHRDRARHRNALEQVLAIARHTCAGPAREAAVLRELARAARSDRALDRAAEYLDEARSVAPYDLHALRARAELAVTQEDYDTCAECLEQLSSRLLTQSSEANADADDVDIDLGHTTSAGEVLMELASVYIDALGDAARGRATIRRAAEAFGDTPRGDAALRMLASLALGDEADDEVIGALELISEQRRTQADLVNLAKALKRSGRDRSAIDVLETARVREPLPDEAAMLLFALHKELERKRALATSLERGADTAPNDVARRRLREALILYEQSLEDEVGTERVLQRLDKLAPVIEPAERDSGSAGEDAAAAEVLAERIERQVRELERSGEPIDAALRDTLRELRELARTGGHYHALARGLATAATAERDRDRCLDMLREVAAVYQAQLSDPKGASEVLARAFALAPEDRTVYAAFDEALTELNDDEQRAAARSMHTRALGSAAHIDTGKLLAAAIDLEERGQVEAAIGRYEEVAAADPADTRPLMALARIFEAQSDYDALTEVLGKQIVAAATGKERAQLWYRRAKLYRDVLHREPETYRCLKEAHANDPTNRDIAYSLRAIAMARGEWALAAELLYREIDSADTDEEAAALHLELAMIFDEKLLDTSQARVNYEQALTLDPEIPAAPAPLMRLYEMDGRHLDAARMGEIASRHARSDDERARLLSRSAACAERAGKKDDARRLYGLSAMFAADAQDSDAAQAAAARLGGEPSNAATRLELIEVRLRETNDPEVAQDLRHQLLELAVAAKDAGAIRRHAGALLETDAADLSAFLALKRAATAVGDWSVLAYLLRTRAGAVDDRIERARLFYELGRLSLDRLGDVGGGISALEQALSADPTHPAALEALADLAYQKNDWTRARTLYAKLHPDACSLPEDVLAFRRGEISDALGELDEAAAAYAEAVRSCPSNRMALAALARTAVQLGDLETAIDASRAMIDFLPPDDVPAIIAARMQVAELCRRADQNALAVEYFEAVRAETPRAVAALGPLAELYAKLERWKDLAKTLEKLADLASEPAERAELDYELGEIYRDRLGDREKAVEVYLRAIDLDPTNTPTLRRLIDYYWEIGDLNSTGEMVMDLHGQNRLLSPETGRSTLARALLAASRAGGTGLAIDIAERLGDARPLAGAMLEAARRDESTIGWLVAAAEAISRAHSVITLAAVADSVEQHADGDESAAKLAAALRAH